MRIGGTMPVGVFRLRGISYFCANTSGTLRARRNTDGPHTISVEFDADSMGLRVSDGLRGLCKEDSIW